MKPKAYLILLALIFAFIPYLVFSQETLTITTYYPSPYGSYNDLYVANRLGIGTTGPEGKLEVSAGGGFVDTGDGHNAAGNVPLLARLGADSTAIGIVNQYDYAAFAINIEGSANSSSQRGVVNFYDRYDGNWRAGLTLKNGNVGIGTTGPTRPLMVVSSDDATIGDQSTSASSWTGMNMNDYLGNLAASFQYGNPSASAFTNEVVVASRQSSIPVIFYQGGIASSNQKIKLESDGDIALINGNVGIGTANPLAPLHISVTPAAYKGILDLRDNSATKAGGNINPYISLFGSDEGSGSTNRAGFMGISGADFYVADEMSTGHMMFWTAGTERMRITSGGNVGIGTANPGAYKLNVNGDFLCNRIATTAASQAHGQGHNFNFDIAEDILAEDCEPGDVVVIAPNNNQKVIKSTVSFDTTVAGIISEDPAFHIGKQDKEGYKPLALAGRVQCKVTTRGGGPIKRGDLLVTSSKPGYAMRTSPENARIGTVLGKALQPLDKGDGKIMVLVTLQ